MRLVLDTNVVTSALLWQGSPRLLLGAAREHRVDLATSLPLLAELSGVLNRPKFASRIASSGLPIDALVDGYAALATLVRPDSIPPQSLDPDDDVVLGTALASRADGICSGDKHLLNLDSFRGIWIATVRQTLQRLAI